MNAFISKYDRTNFVEDSRQILFFITADVVFLAAGTLGSNEILLRSKAYGLEVSDRLGKGFSGNGDVSVFSHNFGLVFFISKLYELLYLRY